MAVLPQHSEVCWQCGLRYTFDRLYTAGASTVNTANFNHFDVNDRQSTVTTQPLVGPMY